MTEATVVHRAVLSAAAPYDFALSLRALEGFSPGAGDHRVAGGRVRRAFLLPGSGPPCAVLAEVGPAPGGVSLALYGSAEPEPPAVAAVSTAVARWLGLDDDLTGFLAVASDDPAMAPVLAVARGLHQVRFPSFAEAAVYFTLTQRSTQWYAAARKRRLAALHGASVVVDGVTYPAFPPLSVVAGLSEESMLAVAGNAQRAARVRGVASGLAALDEEWLRTASYAEVRAELLSISGVGPFTASGLLLRALGRPDDVPLEMAQFVQAAVAVYGEPPPTPAELRERHGPWIGWWAYYARTTQRWIERAEVTPAVSA